MSEIEYHYQYCIGGLHPVHIGDIFQDRYLVVQKLGHGGLATVWLVKDSKEGRWVSLKIIAADYPHTSEVSILQHLKRAQDSGASGSEFVMRIFDDFTIEGPNGIHQCIVAELLGPSLGYEVHDISITDRRLPVDIGKSVSAQVATGLAYLHRHGVIHGDLHPKNILLEIPGIDLWTEQDILTYFGEPILVPDEGTTTAHLPQYGVESAIPDKLLALCLKSIDATGSALIPPAPVRIKICDFGESFFWDGQPKSVELGIPLVYAAPEVFFDQLITPATDIWALAMFMYTILNGGYIFDCYHNDKDFILTEMVLIMGKFPDRWWTTWEGRSKRFDEAGTYTGDPRGVPEPRTGFLTTARLGLTDSEVFEQALSRMVRYEPEERISVDELLPCIQSWNMVGTE